MSPLSLPRAALPLTQNRKRKGSAVDEHATENPSASGTTSTVDAASTPVATSRKRKRRLVKDIVDGAEPGVAASEPATSRPEGLEKRHVAFDLDSNEIVSYRLRDAVANLPTPKRRNAPRKKR